MRRTRSTGVLMLVWFLACSGQSWAAEWYQKRGCPTYPDTTATSLLDHRLFDCRYYRRMNPDVDSYMQSAGLGCDWAAYHWLVLGIYEGRIGAPSFFVNHYKIVAPDVVTYFGAGNPELNKYLALHYIGYGVCEGREGHPTWGGVGLRSDEALKAMTRGPYPAFAYGFNAMRLDSGQYLSVFDAEDPAAPPGIPGQSDAIGARYGSAYDFGTHNGGQDLLMSKAPAGSAWMNVQTANPILVRIGGIAAMYFIEAKPVGVGGADQHVMEMFHTYGDLGNIFGAYLYFPNLAGSFTGAPAGFGHAPSNVAPITEMESWGSHNAGEIVRGHVTSIAPAVPPGVSLIGNITTGPDGVYLYYGDEDGDDDGSPAHMSTRCKLYRRKISPYLTQMGKPEEVADLGPTSPIYYGATNIRVNYHRDLQKWVAVYFCGNGPSVPLDDICVRTFDTGTGFTLNPSSDRPTYGIGMPFDTNIPNVSNHPVGQFGVRTDPEGRMFSDADGQLIVYVPITDVVNAWTLWSDIYAKRVYLY